MGGENNPTPVSTTSTSKLVTPAKAPRFEDIAVRTVTSFIVLDHDSSMWDKTINQAAQFNSDLAQILTGAGYLVQTVRIVTNPYGEYLDVSSSATALADMAKIKAILDALPPATRVRFAIGAARNADDLAVAPDLIKNFGDIANICINIGVDDFGVPDLVLCNQAAACVRTVSENTESGEGNFNFTANFNCAPGIPYFPAGYNTTAAGATFALGMEYPNLLVNVLTKQAAGNPTIVTSPENRSKDWAVAFASMQAAVEGHVATLAGLATSFGQAHGLRFAGIDSSPAPSKNADSLVDVFALLGTPFGSAGTLEGCGFLTRLFKSIRGCPLIGFSGLMLACLEDQGLADTAGTGAFDIRALLQYSAVCGIGLDTVPVPGDISADVISGLMRDTGTMAFRLNKPLTVRLFPCPGLKAGDLTQFTSEDLCNCLVFAVPAGPDSQPATL